MYDPLAAHSPTPWSLGPCPPATAGRPAPAAPPPRIARVWQGRTPASAAGEYLRYVRDTGVADALGTAGNRGVLLGRRIEGDEARFLVVSLWDGLEAVRVFAGPDVETARYYPDDARWLRELPPRVEHYLVPVFTTRR